MPVYLRRLKSGLRFVLPTALLLSFAGSLMAQLNKGSIVGTITDPKGGVVPGADVVLTEEQTQTKNEAKADSAGI